MPEHSTLTGSSLHEPKGVAAAAANTVYVANGSGSGTWQKVAVAQLNSASATDDQVLLANGSGAAAFETVNGLKQKILTVELADISTASSCWVVSPIAGTITKIYSVIDGAITGADAVITPSIGGVNITSGAITIANSGSAAGDVDSSTPSANNTVSAGQAIRIQTDGGSTNTVKAVFTIYMTV